MTQADIFHYIQNLLIVGWFSISEAAAYCSTSKRTVEMWIKEQGLRYSRVRGKRLIKREWLDSFLEEHETTKNDNRIDALVDGILEDLN